MFLASGCSVSGAPLGGPYGGSVEMLAPTDGGFANVDATISPPDPYVPVPQGRPGSWTHLFSIYLDKRTIGNCPTCHSDMDDAADSYHWLFEQGYLGTLPPPLTNHGSSCLAWYGGNMPPGARRQNAQAVQDFDDWVQAGAQND